MRLLPRSRRASFVGSAILAALVAAAVLSTASLPAFLRVAAPRDGVVVKSLSADLAFGADAVAAPPAATVALPPAAAPSLTDVATLLRPETLFEDEEPPPTFSEFTFAPPRDPCPVAPEGTFPQEAASTLVKGVPKPGQYPWKQSGTFQVGGLLPLPVPALTVRTIRQVPTSTPDAILAYEIEQVGYAGKEIDTIEVRYTGRSSTDGVYLTRLQYIAHDYKIDFNPLPLTAPQLFPLPITPTAAPVSASAVDVEDRLALQVSGQVDGRNRVRLDACGEIVEAWKFSGTRVLQGLPPNQDQGIRDTTYELYLAPQLGGLIVGDHVVTSGNVAGIPYQSDITSNIGALQPRSPAR